MAFRTALEAAGATATLDAMRLHHLAFRTADLARLEAFYERIVGLQVVQRREGSVWLGCEGGVIMLEAAKPGEPGIASGSLELVAFAIDASERDAVAARLKENGVALEAATPFTLYARDPDGRRVGFSHYAFDAVLAAVRPTDGAAGTPAAASSSSISSRSSQSPSK
jgi:glyoxylase I family protein